MNMKLRPYIEAFQNLPHGIDQAEAHLEEQMQRTVSVQDGKLASAQFFNKSAVYVRAAANGRTGIAYTENLNEEPAAVMRRAAENARAVSSSGGVSFTPPGLETPSLPGGPLEPPSLEELLQAAAQLEQEARPLCGGARLAGCSLSYKRYADEAANSLGLALKSACGYYSLECQVVCEQGGRSGGKRFVLLSESPNGFPLAKAAESAAASARLQAAPPSPAPSGTYDVLISADAACDFLFMLWRSMSAAQQRQSGAAFAGKEGQKIGADCLSIVSSPMHPGCPIRYRFDNEGMPVAHTRLMDRGVFRSLMHNRSTALERGITSTGNAGRRVTMSGVVQVPLLVTPKVLYIEAGEKSRAGLLEMAGSGLVIETILDSFHGIDYSSGEFSVPVMCSVIRAGEICAAGGALVWSGSLQDVLRSVRAAGSEMHFSCFRDSYSLGAPDLLVQSQTFSGGG